MPSIARRRYEETRSLKSTRSRVTLGILGLLLVLALAASVTVGSRSGTCSRCHQGVAAAQGDTSHASIDCYECHVDGAWDLPRQKLAEVFLMYPRAVVGAGLTGPARQISRPPCLGCHPEIENTVSTGEYVRVDHANCAPQASCDRCHASTAHGSAVRWATGPVMDRCVGCHEAEGISTACDVCHLAGREARLNGRGPWQVTHGPDRERTHGMGDLSTCDACHPASTFDTTGFCAGCHGIDVPHTADFGGEHGRLAIADIDSCRTCHNQETLCDACHQMDMPHPAEFTAQHSRIATGDQDARCLRCHVSTDCAQCHTSHLHPGGSAGVPVPWRSTSEDRRPAAR